jgi:hypothetical protein
MDDPTDVLLSIGIVVVIASIVICTGSIMYRSCIIIRPHEENTEYDGIV